MFPTLIFDYLVLSGVEKVALKMTIMHVDLDSSINKIIRSFCTIDMIRDVL